VITVTWLIHPLMPKRIVTLLGRIFFIELLFCSLTMIFVSIRNIPLRTSIPV